VKKKKILISIGGKKHPHEGQTKAEKREHKNNNNNNNKN
jgi:hypothetical protein